MTDSKDKSDAPNWAGKAALAGAAIGSAALTAALLYATRRKDKGDKAKVPPVNPPETD